LSFSTPALVARSVNYGESDRILDLLTQEQGKLSVVARGARRSRKRFGGALSLFIIGEAVIRPAVRGKLKVLERFDSLEDLGPGICRDVVKMAHGSYMLELARELWPADQPEPAGWRMLCEALKALSNLAQPSTQLLRAFELQILTCAGLGPSLDVCVSCGAPPRPDQPVLLNVSRGGILCQDCAAHGHHLSHEAHQALRTLMMIPINEASQQEVQAEAAKEMREIMLQLVRHHLGKDLKSLDFIAQLKGC